MTKIIPDTEMIPDRWDSLNVKAISHDTMLVTWWIFWAEIVLCRVKVYVNGVLSQRNSVTRQVDLGFYTHI